MKTNQTPSEVEDRNKTTLKVQEVFAHHTGRGDDEPFIEDIVALIEQAKVEELLNILKQSTTYMDGSVTVRASLIEDRIASLTTKESEVNHE